MSFARRSPSLEAREAREARERSKRREGREAGAFKNFQRWSCRFSLEEMENRENLKC